MERLVFSMLKTGSRRALPQHAQLIIDDDEKAKHTAPLLPGGYCNSRGHDGSVVRLRNSFFSKKIAGDI